MERVYMHTVTARVLHWINAIAIFILIATGFYIHAPIEFGFLAGSMDSARFWHFVFMWVVAFGFLYRVIWSAITGDWREIMFRFKDIKGFPSLIKYYTFMASDHPNYGKYNPGQKMTYTLFPVLVGVQVVTGLVLYWPNELATLGTTLGGIATVRLIHYLVTWLFICMVAAHVYLASINGWEMLKSIFTGYVPADHAPGVAHDSAAKPIVTNQSM